MAAQISMEEDFLIAKNVAVLGLELCGMANSLSGVGVKKVREPNHAVWAEFWLNLFRTEEGARFLGEHDPVAHRRAEMTAIWDTFVSQQQREWSRVWVQEEGGAGAYPGEDIHRAVTQSMANAKKLVPYLPCIPQLELWNWEEKREATLGEATRKFLTLLQEHNSQLQALRDQSSQELQAQPNHSDTRALLHGQGTFEFSILFEQRFSDQEAHRFLQSRGARAPGVVGEMKEAREVALKALILVDSGSGGGIGVKELGYLGVESEEGLLASGSFSHLLIRYQKVEFPHRMNAPPPGFFPPLPLDYLTLTDELQGLHGVALYASRAAAAAGIPVNNGCPDCIFSPLVLEEPPTHFTSAVYMCRACLAPQAWNYARDRKASVSETMAFLIATILSRKQEIRFLEDAAKSVDS